jgi:cytochrome c553
VQDVILNEVKDLSDSIRAFRVAGAALAALLSLAALPAAAASLSERLVPCLACHGNKGQSTIPEVPSLGVQPAYYLSPGSPDQRSTRREEHRIPDGPSSGWPVAVLFHN